MMRNKADQLEPGRRGAGILPPLPARSTDANKGDCGKVLVVGGCRGMSGAPCLAARAAYRAGAGLVRIAVPESIWDIVAARTDECTTAGLPSTPTGSLSRAAVDSLLKKHAPWAAAVVLGPGLSQDAETLASIRAVVARLATPLVLDADGLNAFAGKLDVLLRSGGAADGRMRIRVLTPHPGEAARLLATTVAKVQADRFGAARELAARSGAVVVLKGAGTLVCDGRHLYENSSGNPGMATGGSGDVLSGIIAALLGQGMNGFDAARLGVYLHGLAGDLVLKEKGVHALIAGDLIEALPRAFLAYARANSRANSRTRARRAGGTPAVRK